MRSEATGPRVRHEGFDVDEKISLILQGSASEWGLLQRKGQFLVSYM